jgi:hypothetical protein
MPASYQCVFCKNYNSELKCKAFPDGIPEEILTGEHDHTEPFEGDNGIRFEPIDKDERLKAKD